MNKKSLGYEKFGKEIYEYNLGIKRLNGEDVIVTTNEILTEEQLNDMRRVYLEHMPKKYKND